MGLADIASKMMVSGCLVWATIGGAVLLFPVSILCYGFYTIHVLMRKNELTFTRFDSRSFKEIWQLVSAQKGIRPKLASLLICISDKRFVGDWQKHSARARFWAFFLANTGVLWFCFAIALAKKLSTCLVLNWTTGPVNAVFLMIIYWFDTITGVILRGHRDHVCNFSGACTNISNGLAITLAALPIILPEDWVPSWVKGPIVMFLLTAGTAVQAIVAMLEPAKGFYTMVKNILSQCGLIALAGPLVAMLRGAKAALLARAERIMQGRTKAAAKKDLQSQAQKETSADAKKDRKASSELTEEEKHQRALQEAFMQEVLQDDDELLGNRSDSSDEEMAGPITGEHAKVCLQCGKRTRKAEREACKRCGSTEDWVVKGSPRGGAHTPEGQSGAPLAQPSSHELEKAWKVEDEGRHHDSSTIFDPSEPHPAILFENSPIEIQYQNESTISRSSSAIERGEPREPGEPTPRDVKEYKQKLIREAEDLLLSMHNVLRLKTSGGFPSGTKTGSMAEPSKTKNINEEQRRDLAGKFLIFCLDRLHVINSGPVHST